MVTLLANDSGVVFETVGLFRTTESGPFWSVIFQEPDCAAQAGFAQGHWPLKKFGLTVKSRLLTGLAVDEDA
jgi:hypothetical protein